MTAKTAERPTDPIDNEDLFLAWILEETGLYLQSHQLPGFRQSVRDALECFGHDSAGDFLEHLRHSTVASPERQFLIARITVGETYFNRIPDQIAFLRERWLPEAIARKRAAGHLTLRIWSAACSGGEELYTLALLLRELLPDIRNWNLHLIGTDINPDAIAKAREGVYSAWSLRALAPNDIPLYFDKRGKHFELHRNIREMGQFSILNLARDDYPSVAAGISAMDLVLCRNVFIYFTQPVISAIMARFADTLAEDGCLLLAPSDLVEQKYPGLSLANRDGVFYYEREQAVVPTSRAIHEIPLPDSPPMPDVTSFAWDDIASPVAEPLETMVAAEVHEGADPWADALAFLAGHHWQAALDVAERIIATRPDEIRGYWLRATALSALGEPEAALASCLRGLEISPMAAELHHLHAMLLLDRNDHRAAEVCFKSAVYLDWNRADSHFQLGMLKARRHDFKAAHKHLQDALSIAADQPADALLPPPSEMSYGRLVEILSAEIGAFDRRHGQQRAA